MSIATEESRRVEKERIHTEATGMVIGACCQIFAAICRSMDSECRKHGIHAMRIHVSSKEDREAEGLIDSMKAALAEDLPLSPSNAVEYHDDFCILSSEEVDELAELVKETVSELLGVFRAN